MTVTSALAAWWRGGPRVTMYERLHRQQAVIFHAVVEERPDGTWSASVESASLGGGRIEAVSRASSSYTDAQHAADDLVTQMARGHRCDHTCEAWRRLERRPAPTA